MKRKRNEDQEEFSPNKYSKIFNEIKDPLEFKKAVNSFDVEYITKKMDELITVTDSNAWEKHLPYINTVLRMYNDTKDCLETDNNTKDCLETDNNIYKSLELMFTKLPWTFWPREGQDSHQAIIDSVDQAIINGDEKLTKLFLINGAKVQESLCGLGWALGDIQPNIKQLVKAAQESDKLIDIIDNKPCYYTYDTTSLSDQQLEIAAARLSKFLGGKELNSITVVKELVKFLECNNSEYNTIFKQIVHKALGAKIEEIFMVNNKISNAGYKFYEEVEHLDAKPEKEFGEEIEDSDIKPNEFLNKLKYMLDNKYFTLEYTDMKKMLEKIAKLDSSNNKEECCNKFSFYFTAGEGEGEGVSSVESNVVALGEEKSMETES